MIVDGCLLLALQRVTSHKFSYLLLPLANSSLRCHCDMWWVNKAVAAEGPAVGL